MIGARVFTPTVYFYKSNYMSSNRKPVTKTLCDALSRVLVPYYPLSGRLREASNGKLEVFFGQEQGALMVEAHSDMGLAELGDLAVPNPTWAPLNYRFPNEEPYKVLDMPLIIAQFLAAWAATAKTGTLVTNPEPCWDREFFQPRNPPTIKYRHPEFMRIEEGSSLTMSLWKSKPVQKCYKVSQQFQAQLKSLAQPNDMLGCSTFDAMAAHVWRSWVKALDVKPVDYELRLTFSVNARPKLKNPPLKQGFYGNVVCVACGTSPVNNLIKGSLSETSRLVREARLSISEEYVRSTVDYMEIDRPNRLEFGGKLSITQWTRFSLYESADFGWGRPSYAGPIDLTPTPQVCVFLPDGSAECSGATVVCICLPGSATHKFTEFFFMFEGFDFK